MILTAATLAAHQAIATTTIIVALTETTAVETVVAETTAIEAITEAAATLITAAIAIEQDPMTIEEVMKKIRQQPLLPMHHLETRPLKLKLKLKCHAKRASHK